MFAPSKLLGDRLATIAQAVGSLNAPTKLTDLGGVPGTGYDPGTSSFAPSKTTNFTPADPLNTDPFTAFSGGGAPMKLGASTLGGMFPGAQNPSPAVTTPVGTGASMGGDWAGVDQWNAQIAAAAAKYGVPQNLIKAVMKLESNGDPNATGADGVWGPMQVNSNAWGDGPWMHDAAANIDKGAQILADAYKNNGNDWTMALRAYHGFGSDGYTTDQQYADIVNGNWTTLNNVQQSGGGATTTTGGLSSMFGSGAHVATGQTDGFDGGFNLPSDNGYYGYGTDYGLNGINHTGLDIPLTPGTAMRSAFSGHVVCAGTGNGTGEDACAAFSCSGYCVGGSAGRIEIMSDDGNTVLIYGHSSTSSVRPGQRVNAGDVLGTSGGENSGHVHLEARVRDSSTPSGWRIVDPQTVLGQFGATGATAITSPATYASGSFAHSLAQFAQQYGR